MKLTTKDAVGVVLVLGTAAVVLVHNSPLVGHRASHVRPVVDVGGAVTSASEAQVTVFHDVDVVPMDRAGVLRRQVVIVEDGFITRVGPVGVVEPPAGARRIDGGGRYLVPGLTDAHVHLGDDAEHQLGLYVANGVTTVFNLEGRTEHLALRERVLAGDVVGPTIYTAGPFVDGTVVRTPADAERVVREQRARGFDFVKLHGDLGRANFAALTRAGIREGMPVLGHAQRDLPLAEVLRNRQAAITHAEELIYTELMTLEESELHPVADAMSGSNTWLAPGVVTFRNTVRLWGSPEGMRETLDGLEAAHLPRAMRRRWERSRALAEQDPAGRARLGRMLDFHAPLVRTFHEAGVPLLAGTDAGIPGIVPGFSIHEEIGALEAAGLSTHAALAIATRNGGRFVRQFVDGEASFGTVSEGARADLVLVEGDPLRDPATLRTPVGVMVRGRWLDRGELDRLLAGGVTPGG